MQWLINEFKALKEEVSKRIERLEKDIVFTSLSNPIEARVKKLEGELMALKARLGKNKDKDDKNKDGYGEKGHE